MNPNDPMIEVYVYENSQLLENLEELLMKAEQDGSLESDQIDEIFRVMHTIKGSSSMMSFDKLALVAHAIEDLFSQIRLKRPRNTDWARICDIVLQGADFCKVEIAKIQDGHEPDGNGEALVNEIHEYLDMLANRRIPEPKEPEIAAGTSAEAPEDEDEDALELPGSFYRARLFFEPDCKMENVRAFGVINTIQSQCVKLAHIPEDVLADGSDALIADNGFTIYMKIDMDQETLYKMLMQTLFLKTCEITPVDESDEELPASIRKRPASQATQSSQAAPTAGVAAPIPSGAETHIKQNYISVNVNKLNKLMDLVGEIVTTESMVIKNPDLENLQLDSFEKSAMQLKKLTDELQDVVMSIRMIPVSATFHKMTRIVRDMSKKVKKEAELVIIGEETELDKNIIDNLGDPLMHLIRNSMDHGLETPEDRVAAGKPSKGIITLEARNTGSDVTILISDNGRGLNRDKLVQKAIANGITTKSDAEISDKEAYSFILAPGFSTKEQVTEFSGRGVGMDVVHKNIEKVGGTISIDSTPGQGMTTTIRIPLTLAIMDGMKITVGDSSYIVPMLSIRQSMNPSSLLESIITDPDGNEMIMIRGDCYPIHRLNNIFGVPGGVESYGEGIMLIIESEKQTYCLFVDKLIGEQQAVVKPLPSYITSTVGNIKGVAGCTILGDGSISLILDVNNLVPEI